MNDKELDISFAQTNYLEEEAVEVSAWMKASMYSLNFLAKLSL